METLGMDVDEDILAVISPQAIPEIDICFTSEGAYLSFWERCKATLWEDGSFLRGVTLVPLYRGETKW